METWRGRYRADRWSLVRTRWRQARENRPCDEGLWSDGRVAESIPAFGVEHPAGCGRLAQTFANRPYRSLPNAPRGSEYAVGGNLAGYGGARPARQGDLCRLIQFCWLAYCQSE